MAKRKTQAQRDIVGLTLASISACCTSMAHRMNIDGVTDEQHRRLYEVYEELLAMQQRVIAT